jgi:hypothetical protein
MPKQIKLCLDAVQEPPTFLNDCLGKRGELKYFN